jgi:opacity protein-like surface antigen
MLRTKSLAALLVGTALISLPAFSQEEGPLQNRSEASVSFFGSFLKNTNQNGVRQSSSDSGGVLAGYRFFFTNHHGVEVNYGYSRNTVSYDFGAGPFGTNTNQHEITGAYIFRLPMRRVTPFAEAGFGGLIFSPRNFAGGNSQGRVAFLYGAGADISLSKRLFVRAAYRGLVFNSPTFNIPANLGADRTTHQAEPTIGLGYKF